jgi:hypothetical protein
MGKRVSVHDFRDDPMFRRIERVVADLLARGNVVTPVDVLIGMGLLRLDHLSDWRCGRVPYLERVIECNLMRLSRLLRILRFHAHDLDLKPSATVYNRYGKGPKRRLRFSRAATHASKPPTRRISYGPASGRSTHGRRVITRTPVWTRGDGTLL